MSEPRLTLPPIDLSDMSPLARDFVLAVANERGCSPADAILAVLDVAADLAPVPSAVQAASTTSLISGGSL